MEQIRELLRHEKFQPVRFGRGATDAEISVAESMLGIAFPVSYKDFLRQYGWIESPYINVFGLGADIDSAFDVSQVTQSERIEAEPGLPSHLIPVLNDGSGNLFCLDMSQKHEGECPVVFWDHECPEGVDQNPVRAGVDFYSWLVNEIQQIG